MNEIMQQNQQWIAGTYRRFPVQLVRGEGALFWDDQGKQYIDLGSGIAVNTLGSGHAGWCQDWCRERAACRCWPQTMCSRCAGWRTSMGHW